MRKMTAFVAAICFGSMLSACGGSGDDSLGDKVENAADARADALDAQADQLEQRAEDVRDTGEARSDAIDAADLNTDNMTESEKAAVVANEAPAVR